MAFNPFRKARDLAKRAQGGIARVARRVTGRTPPAVPTPQPPKPPEPPVTRPAAPSIADLVESIQATGIATDAAAEHIPDSHGADRIEDLIEEMGAANARTLLREQLESANAYKRGSLQPGNARWVDRQRRLAAMFTGAHAPFDTYDPYFYYHARKD